MLREENCGGWSFLVCDRTTLCHCLMKLKEIGENEKAVQPVNDDFETLPKRLTLEGVKIVKNAGKNAQGFRCLTLEGAKIVKMREKRLGFPVPHFRGSQDCENA